MDRRKARQIIATWLVSGKGEKGQRGYIEGWFDEEDVEAFELAIEALEEKPQKTSKNLKKPNKMDACYMAQKSAVEKLQPRNWEVLRGDRGEAEKHQLSGETSTISEKETVDTDLISRQAAIDAVEKAVFKGVAKSSIESLPPVEPKRLPQPHKCVVYRDGECRYPIEACSECPKHEGMRAVLAERPKGEWVSCSEPPKDRRNVFLAYGTNDFKSCCIGHYEQGMGWYEDRNFFAKPIYDCKYWCDIPDLPDMGDNQFDMRGENDE